MAMERGMLKRRCRVNEQLAESQASRLDFELVTAPRASLVT